MLQDVRQANMVAMLVLGFQGISAIWMGLMKEKLDFYAKGTYIL